MQVKLKDRFNRHPVRNRILALAATAILAGVAVTATTIATSTEFQDTHSGIITGTVGHVAVQPGGGSGADHTDLQFSDKFKPGDKQAVTGTYKNVGSLPQDLYLLFDPDAAGQLNTLGTYGEFHIAVNGTEVFASVNLNNNHTSCPPGSTSQAHPEPCREIPLTIKIADNVAPGERGTWSITFAYADKLSTNPSTDTDWNVYDGGAKNGLPYQISSVQAGGHAPVYTPSS